MSNWCSEPEREVDRRCESSRDECCHCHKQSARVGNVSVFDAPHANPRAEKAMPRVRRSWVMQVIYQRCCGLDVHKKTVVATVLITSPDGTIEKKTRTFSTMTTGLLALCDWVDSYGVSHVAMESTGIYWRPVYQLLEEGHTILLVNAQHMKAVPGHKTDVKDSEWLADLLRHGLLKASFIPPQPIRQLRELTRYRKSLIQERAQEVNRLQKVLETANIKLAAVAT